MEQSDKRGEELQKLLGKLLSQRPGYEKILADKMRVSIPTLVRWSKGQNMPHQAMLSSILDYLKRLHPAEN